MALIRKPPKFNSVEHLQGLINDFWEFIEVEDKVPTIERLCCFLKCDRHTLLNYSKDSEYFTTIKNCKNNIFSEQKEMALAGRINASVFIFNAKNNYNYVDRIETVNKNVSVVLEAKEATDIIENILQERTELPVKELTKQLPSAPEPTAAVIDNTTTPIPKPEK